MLGGGERPAKHGVRELVKDAQTGAEGRVRGPSSQGLAGARPTPLPGSVFRGVTRSLETTPGAAFTGKRANTTSRVLRGSSPRIADGSPGCLNQGPAGSGA